MASMPTFDYTFEVPANVEQVAAFHEDARVLQRLTPAYVKIHRVDPLADGAIALRVLFWYRARRTRQAVSG